ncbi:F-type H+-transporting ATPase subunit b [Rubritalea squalenifaciens DSM 18772]|uniref:ATP synthase subunit b n=2 Tax=Rubritalea TaxID=361050 RepID=A0A1M6DLZ7_9BACT|nr:F0F1 ATP synthase subunit B [Rubritalea squalenifaciens]SHI74205.1 F-type H+-transporting ATPase subunit b [Rubritalea squalenifaciens DSM 18772]
MITTLAADANKFTMLTEQFGVHGPWLIAQVINFIIVIIVLKKFAFGPIIEILEKRKNRIAEGEEKLKRIETQLAESEERTAAALEKANADAKRLIDEAKESAANLTEQKSQEAIASAQAILAKAEDAAKAERAQMVNELKADFGKLVAATTASVTGKVLTEEDKKRINDEAVASVQG